MNGIIFPSYVDPARLPLATATAVVGGWAAEYPLANVVDLVRPSKIARASAAGDRSFNLNFATAVSIGALALIGHNAPDGATFYIVMTAGPDATGTTLYEGTHEFWPGLSAPNPAYRSIRPLILPATVAGVRTIRILIYAHGAPLEIGAVDVGGFWEWPLGYGREIGFKTDDREIDLAGGASYRPEKRKLRTVSGQVDLMAMAETSTTGLDFQKGLDLHRPFVWAEDWSDPTSWTRKCILARNDDLPLMAGALYRRDAFPVRLIEHVR